jgi:hypothetical protein
VHLKRSPLLVCEQCFLCTEELQQSGRPMGQRGEEGAQQEGSGPTVGGPVHVFLHTVLHTSLKKRPCGQEEHLRNTK